MKRPVTRKGHFSSLKSLEKASWHPSRWTPGGWHPLPGCRALSWCSLYLPITPPTPGREGGREVGCDLILKMKKPTRGLPAPGQGHAVCRFCLAAPMLASRSPTQFSHLWRGAPLALSPGTGSFKAVQFRSCALLCPGGWQVPPLLPTCMPTMAPILGAAMNKAKTPTSQGWKWHFFHTALQVAPLQPLWLSPPDH